MYTTLQESLLTLLHAPVNNNNNNLGPVPHFAPWKHCSQCGLLYIPVAFLNVPALAARCLPYPQPAVVPLAAKGGTMGEKWWPNGAWDMHPRFFYMPQICDMGPIILLPFRRQACWGCLLNPRTWVSGQHLCTTEAVWLWQYHDQFFLTVRNVSERSCWENKTTQFVCPIDFFFFSENFKFCETIWKDIVQPDRPKMTTQLAAWALHAG